MGLYLSGKPGRKDRATRGNLPIFLGPFLKLKMGSLLRHLESSLSHYISNSTLITYLKKVAEDWYCGRTWGKVCGPPPNLENSVKAVENDARDNGRHCERQWERSPIHN